MAVPDIQELGHVTLRLRLVAGLVLLMTVGLAIFGVTMYELYSRSLYSQLRTDLQSSVPLVVQELAEEAGIPFRAPGVGSHNGGGPAPGGYEHWLGSQPPPGGAVLGHQPPDNPGNPGTSVLVAPGTYGELVGKSAATVDYVSLPGGSSRPLLSRALLTGTATTRVMQVGSVKGGTEWLTYIGPLMANGDRVVVAVPTTQVTGSLHRLVLIEVLGATGLLLILSAGAGLVLRQGLSPLEHMADTAKVIAAGDLDRRVQVDTQGTEVGQLALAFNTMLDEIQQAFAARDETEHRLRQFLADASHELRTPLTSIQGFAELFRLGTGNNRVGTATIMRRIEEESARMTGLVEDLLLLARLGQVRHSEPAAVDMSVLAADACSDAIAASPDRPVTLSAPEPVIVLGDEDHLRQALANLVTNALRHTPPGSAVEVSARLQNGYAVTEVRDHGPGLDEEALAHAFDRFWQRDPARAGAGAGLGLAIVAAITTEHGGSVSAANAPGGGAAFSVRIPLVPDQRGEAPTAKPVIAGPVIAGPAGARMPRPGTTRAHRCGGNRRL
jgi:two-component system OmpR family sensor kinase